MKKLLSLTLLLASVGQGQGGDYRLQLPLGLQEEALYLPNDNPLTGSKVSLGRQLFFDPRLSVDESLSCSSCHDPSKAFSDGRDRAVGVSDLVGRRNTPTILNRAFSKEQFWMAAAPTSNGRPGDRSSTRLKWASRKPD